jgi:hypothetical protein
VILFLENDVIFIGNDVSDWSISFKTSYLIGFNEGVINMGRILVLFAFTSQMGQQYPTNAWKFWDIYHAVLKGTEYIATCLIGRFLSQRRI